MIEEIPEEPKVYHCPECKRVEEDKERYWRALKRICLLRDDNMLTHEEAANKAITIAGVALVSSGPGEICLKCGCIPGVSVCPEAQRLWNRVQEVEKDDTNEEEEWDEYRKRLKLYKKHFEK